MRSKWTVLLITMLILNTIYMSRIVFSKPSWLKPGFYVEYKFPMGEACTLSIRVAIDDLVDLGVLHVHRFGNYTIFSDLSRKEIEEIYAKRGEEIPRHENLSSLLITANAIDLIKKLVKEGKLSQYTGERELKYKWRYTIERVSFTILTATYSWKCVGFREGLAEFEVRFTGRVRFRGHNETEKSLDKVFRVLVDPKSRKTYTIDGEYIGVTPLWIPKSELKLRREVLICAIRKADARGTVWYPEKRRTPLGTIEILPLVKLKGKVHLIGGIAYEKDTGILASAFRYSDPVLGHFMDIQLISFSISNPMVISRVEGVSINTYHDGLYEQITTIGVPILAVACVLVLLLVKYARRRKEK